jgi:hypothetical protein
MAVEELKPSVIRIMAASLVSGQKYTAYSVFDGENLIITQVELIPWADAAWKSNLIAEIKDRTEKGFIVLVEEKTDHISQYGTKYLLDELWEGRTNFCDAMDWYFALQATGNLIFHKSCDQYKLYSGGEGQRVDKKTDDKGRTVYHVDWSAFHGGYRAILLCVVAAMTEPVSHRYLNAMFGPPGVEADEFDPLRQFRAITIGHDIAKATWWEEYDRHRT